MAKTIVREGYFDEKIIANGIYEYSYKKPIEGRKDETVVVKILLDEVGNHIFDGIEKVVQFISKSFDGISHDIKDRIILRLLSEADYLGVKNIDFKDRRNEWCVIDRSGRFCIKPVVQYISYNSYFDLFVVDHKFHSNEIVDEEFAIEYFGLCGDYVIISENGKRGLIGREGKEIAPPIFYSINTTFWENEFIVWDKQNFGFYHKGFHRNPEKTIMKSLLSDKKKEHKLVVDFKGKYK